MRPQLLLIFLSLGGGGFASPVLPGLEDEFEDDSFLMISQEEESILAKFLYNASATTTTAAPPLPLDDPILCSKECKEEFDVCPPIVSNEITAPHILYYWPPDPDRKNGFNPISLQLSDQTYFAHCTKLENNSLEFDIARNGGPKPKAIEIPVQILNTIKIQKLVEHARIFAKALYPASNCSTIDFISLVIEHGLFTPASKWVKTFDSKNHVDRSPRGLFYDVRALVNEYEEFNCSGVRKMGDLWRSGCHNSDASFLIVTIVTGVGIFLVNY